MEAVSRDVRHTSLCLAGFTALTRMSLGLRDDLSGFLLMFVTFGGIGNFAWVTRSVWCTIATGAMREQPAGVWWEWLKSLLLCPVCGATGEETGPRRW